MRGRVRSVSSEERSSLSGDWVLRRASAVEVAPAQAFDATDARSWTRIDGPGTVAAALRGVGLWSIDGPTLRFDADDWWFRARFELEAETAPVSRSIVFGGLAGRAEA